jgi:dihydropteroate synthase
MGIVNVTPDSFYDHGATAAPSDAVAHGLGLLERGAGALDIGGMTAQPGAEITTSEEIDRVVPVISAIRAQTDAVISVDTYRAPVARAALTAGADLVNDHTGLSDPEMMAAVADAGAGLVITHLGLKPKQARTGTYSITVDAIAEFLTTRAEAAVAAGVAKGGILIDPGLGFGKDTDTDLETLRRLTDLVGLGYPLLLACSHKEVTAAPLGLPESSLEGTAAVAAIAAFLGVAVLRLHDLPSMAHAARMGWLMRRGE